MGSLGAMQAGSRDRYQMDTETNEAKLVPEGIEGRVPHKGITVRHGDTVGWRPKSRNGLLWMLDHPRTKGKGL
jgi:hypothetical protein